MLGNFSEESQLILLKAREEMLELNHPYVGTEHLVLSILKNDENLSVRLASFGLNYDNFKKEIIDVIDSSPLLRLLSLSSLLGLFL